MMTTQRNDAVSKNYSADCRVGHRPVGIANIPQDWTVRTISEIADVKTGPFGSSLHQRDYVDEGTPIITVEHLGERGVIHEGLPLISESDRSRLASYRLRQGDIVFSRVGSVDRNSLVSEKEDGWLFSGRLLRVRVSDKNVCPAYLSYHFDSEPFKRRVRDVAVGQTMASLNTQILNSVAVVLPPLREQRAIAGALSDVDESVGALEALIAKKQDIKLGAMQRLLTGETRLPGYGDSWTLKPLIELAQITMGQSPSSAFYNLSGDGYPLIQGNADIRDRRTFSRVWSTRGSKYCDAGDLILTVRAPVGAVAMATENSYLGRGIAGLKPFGTSGFLFHALVHAEARWQILEQGSTFTAANSKQVDEFRLYVPENEGERTAIAKLLTNMDTEIATLEQRRNKMLAIKQGMMQELLTGRTRLV